MKRILTLSLALAMLLSMCFCVNVYASENTNGTNSAFSCTDDGFEYSIHSGEAWVIHYRGTEKDVTVPTEIEGYPVTRFISTFYQNEIVERVVIPDSIETVDYHTFFVTPNLKEIVIGKDVKKIDGSAISYCKKLENIYVDDENESYCDVDGVLYTKDLKKLVAYPIGNKRSSYEILDGVEYISANCFGSSKNLESITMPDSVKTVGTTAFKYATNLKTVTISENLAEIYTGAFYGCKSLASIELPNSITIIAKELFYGCKSLKTIELPNFITKIGEKAFADCNNLTNIKLPTDLEVIDTRAFVNCKSLLQINFPTKLVTIGNDAFRCCTSLKVVDIPKSVVWLGGNSFVGCTNLKYIRVLGKDSIIDDNVAIPPPYGMEFAPLCDTNTVVYGYSGSPTETHIKTIKSKTGKTVKFVALDKMKSLSKPTLKSAKNTVDGVNITWGVSNGASGYRIYRKTGSGNWKLIATVKNNVFSYTDKTAKNSFNYKYTVRSYCSSIKSSYDKNGISVKRLEAPKITSLTNTINGINVKWNKIAGANGYYVYKKTAGEESWTRIATVKGGAKTAFKDTAVKSGVTYQYTVRAYYGSSKGAYFSNNDIYATFVSTPKINSAVANENSITLKWNEVSSADGYRLYRKTDVGSWKLIGTVSGANTIQFTDTTAEPNVDYKYTIKAFKGDSKSSYYGNGIACKITE